MKSIQNWLWISLMMVLAIMNSCGVDITKEKPSSFETMIVAKSDIEVPVKFSAKMKGLAGWTNSAGGAIVNPGKILLNAVASLTQPIYAQGKLKANLKINQLEQQDLMNQYVQTVIDAGSEVNEALADCQAAVEKHGYYHRQVEVLKDAYKGTHELMDNGKASYLEVLTAQETLLNAQLNEAVNMYNGAQGIIALYIALGGATR